MDPVKNAVVKNQFMKKKRCYQYGWGGSSSHCTFKINTGDYAHVIETFFISLPSVLEFIYEYEVDLETLDGLLILRKELE